MIKEVYLKTLPAAFMLVVLLVASFVAFEGMLLCFGEDGHVAIEFADACNGSGFGLRHVRMENDSCGLCKDVHFLSSPAFTSKPSYDTQTLPLISSFSMSPTLPLKEYPVKFINLPQHSNHKTLASLHSVVLLI